jgi:acyl-CoA synthetase (AMP-forming)/AMP-acid ligase II
MVFWIWDRGKGKVLSQASEISGKSASQAPGRGLLVGEILRRAAESAPDAPAASMAGRVWSYAELARDADRIALALRDRAGVGHGDRVVCWFDTALEVLPVFFALARLGAVFAPLNARLGADEAGEVAALARGQLLITDVERWPDAPRVGEAAKIERTALLGHRGSSPDAADETDALVLDPEHLPDPSMPIEEPRLVESDPHVIFFTSGSTGKPKGVVLSHRANWLRGFQGVFRDEPERTVCMFPLYHMAGFTLAISAWQTRGEIILVDASAKGILDAVAQRRANRLYALPLVWKRILEEDTSGWDLSSLTQLDTGTSATPIELLEAVKARFPKPALRIYYGSTECGSAAALSDADVLRKPGRVGLASASVDLRLAGDAEVLVRSPFLMDGYFDDPQATREAFAEGWFRTGDLGALDEEGYLSIIGRKKEVLRTGGESVSPAEVEAVLRSAPGVAEVAVVGLPDAEWGELVCAAVVPDAGSRPTLAGLREHCEGRLAGFKKPRRVALLAALPRTSATAQIQRTLLVETILSEDLAVES